MIWQWKKFYEDEENEYKFGAIMSPWIIVYYSNGTTENIVKGHRSIRKAEILFGFVLV